MSSSCCNCCGFTSLIGVIFFAITATMVKRENAVFLSHKAGMDLHTITDDDINKKFMFMVYTAMVSTKSTTSRFEGENTDPTRRVGSGGI